MMKTLFTGWLALAAPVVALAQVPAPTPADTSYWRTSLKAGVNLNEAVISDNWKGGGATSLA